MKFAWHSFFVTLGLVLLPTVTSPTVAESQPVPTAETAPASVVVPTQDAGSDRPLPSEHQSVPPDPAATDATPPDAPAPAAETGPETEASPEAPESTEEATPSDTDTDTEATEDAEPPLSPEEISRRQKIIEADQLYLGGQFAAAEKLYREAKEPFTTEASESAIAQRPEPILDPEQLPPAGRVYWRESTAGLEQKLETRVVVPLNFLVEQYPQFVPGHLRLAEVLQDYNRLPEALKVLERATTLYPNQGDLVKARITALGKANQWMEASLAARQFALMNPSHPEAAEFTQMAEDNLKRFQSNLRDELRGNVIANVITGALGYALTGGLFGPFSALQSTALLLRGESAVGARVAESAKHHLELVKDEEVVAYVNELGHKLAQVAGRNDFEYEFHVIMEDSLNAFALPGGKIFINAGAITRANSEAELAGLMAHELAHAVLSHGFQLATEGNLTANLVQYLPLGGTVANLLVLNYSRDMERQADVLGTRLLASTGYAADGLRNLMVTLKKEDKKSPAFSWLSSHPGTDERIRSLEGLIQQGRFNRYAYEGMSRHSRIQEKLKPLLIEHEKEMKARKKRR